MENASSASTPQLQATNEAKPRPKKSRIIKTVYLNGFTKSSGDTATRNVEVLKSESVSTHDHPLVSSPNMGDDHSEKAGSSDAAVEESDLQTSDESCYDLKEKSVSLAQNEECFESVFSGYEIIDEEEAGIETPPVKHFQQFLDENCISMKSLTEFKGERQACEACLLDEIKSAYGTIRGIKTRVLHRIQSFSGLKYNAEHTCVDYAGNDTNKVVIYTTSLGVVRRTKSECLYVRNVFRNMMLKTEERDINFSENLRLYKERFADATPPQILINGKDIGGRAQLELLIESGEIMALVRNIDKVEYDEKGCLNCGGHKFLNCPNCLGSMRTIVNRYTRQLSKLKCTFCVDGVVRCAECVNDLN